jgi:hypothetical protein
MIFFIEKNLRLFCDFGFGHKNTRKYQYHFKGQNTPFEMGMALPCWRFLIIQLHFQRDKRSRTDKIYGKPQQGQNRKQAEYNGGGKQIQQFRGGCYLNAGDAAAVGTIMVVFVVGVS